MDRSPVIVSTDLAIVWLTREGVSQRHAQRFIYTHSHLGALTNHGAPGRGRARWDLRQIRAIMWPKTQDEHPLHSG